MVSIPEEKLVFAYRAKLRMEVRRLKLEKDSREEANWQQDERLNAITEFNTLEMQYLAEQS